ncbi:MAG: TlpA disulfide reductase family protein [Brevinematales bacterium]|jgi:thiol-disulfide isomerase/thioredoxin
MRLYSALSYALIIILLACCSQGKVKTADPGAKPIEGTDINGKGFISLKNYKGKAVLVNFWATWCPPCRMEIPDLIKLQDNYKGRLIILGISVDQDGSKGVIEFSDQYKINYPVIMAEQSMIKDYGGIEAIPSTFLIDTNGNIVKKFIGEMSYSQYESEIKPYLPN